MADTLSRLDLGPPPRGWDSEVWTLSRTLDVAVRRLPYSSAPARILDGPRRWMSYSGVRRKGDWWPDLILAVSVAVRLADDEPTSRLLAPWTAAIPVSGAASGFRPYDGGEP